MMTDSIVELTRDEPDDADAERFGFVSVSELMEEETHASWMIRDWVPGAGLSLMFGESGHGKTFMALDWALHVAAGLAWHGKAVEQGPVFYIVGEGRTGLKYRIQAWCQWYDVNPHDLPFFVSKVPAQLYDQIGAVHVSDAIVALTRSTQPPALIVIDTLARNFGPGSENSTDDMNQFVNHLDVYFREPFNALLLLVHHPGHGEKERARGAYALHAAMDAEYRVTRDNDLVRLICTKMKDAELPDPMAFNAKKVELPELDDHGTPRSSMIFENTEYTAKVDTSKGLGKAQRQALEVLKRLYTDARYNLEEGGHDPAHARVEIVWWKTALEAEKTDTGKPLLGNYPRQRWRTLKDGLVNGGQISIDGVHVYVDF